VPESRPGHVAHEEPARFREGFRDRLLVTLAIAATLVWGLYSFYEGGVPVFLREERGLALATWGAIFAINPILVTLFQYPIARWAARRQARTMLAAGALLIGLALAVLLPSSGTAVIGLAVAILTFGEMLFEPVASAFAADLAPARLRGTYQSVLNLSLEVAWGPASIVGLWLIGRGQGEIALAAALPVAAGAALLFLLLPGGVLEESPAPLSADPLH
jgi:hypothetical protein